MVPEEGIEPSRPKPRDFESLVSTNSTIQAFYYKNGGAVYNGPIESID
jgi:hypothetical protein